MNDPRIVQIGRPIIVDGKLFEYLPEESTTNSHKIVGLRKPSSNHHVFLILSSKHRNKNNEYVFSQNICNVLFTSALQLVA